MPSNTGEHNCLDRAIAESTAERLEALFGSSPDNLPAIPSNETLGSPQLVDSLDEAPPRRIEPNRGKFEIYAVDGGSSVLARGGNIEVTAWRAGMVRFQDRQRMDEACPPPEILAYNRLTAGDIIKEYAVDLTVEYDCDQPPVKPVDELRWLSEWRLIEQIVDSAGDGSLLLVDGSLRANPVFGIGFQKDILKRAAGNGVHVAAITKQTSLAIGGSITLDNDPGNFDSDYDYWYRQLNRPLGEESGWLGNIYLAGLHPGADKPFRVDINRYDAENVDKTFSMLAAICDDVEFCGYPYPLVAAHRLARIDSLFKGEMVGAVGRALEKRNFPPHMWDYLIGDIHDKLNADIQAREY